MVKKFSKVVGNWSVCDVVLLTAFGMFICEGEHLLSLRWSCLFFRCAVKCSASLYYFVKFVYFFLIKGLLIEKFLKVTKVGLGNIAFKIWFKIRKLHLCEAKAIIKKVGNLMKFVNIGGQQELNRYWGNLKLHKHPLNPHKRSRNGERIARSKRLYSVEPSQTTSDE